MWKSIATHSSGGARVLLFATLVNNCCFFSLVCVTCVDSLVKGLMKRKALSKNIQPKLRELARYGSHMFLRDHANHGLVCNRVRFLSEVF